jgi:hypothetical protein
VFTGPHGHRTVVQFNADGTILSIMQFNPDGRKAWYTTFIRGGRNTGGLWHPDGSMDIWTIYNHFTGDVVSEYDFNPDGSYTVTDYNPDGSISGSSFTPSPNAPPKWWRR